MFEYFDNHALAAVIYSVTIFALVIAGNAAMYAGGRVPRWLCIGAFIPAIQCVLTWGDIILLFLDFMPALIFTVSVLNNGSKTFAQVFFVHLAVSLGAIFFAWIRPVMSGSEFYFVMGLALIALRGIEVAVSKKEE